MTNFEELLSEILPKDSDEYKTLIETHDLITKNAPTIAGEMKTNMILLDQAKIHLSTLYYMLSRNISKMKSTFKNTYDAQYTRLVKLGRPSNQAIETEIRASNPEYSGLSQKIEDYEQLKDLVTSYIKGIDSAKSTVVELLRDSRRID